MKELSIQIKSRHTVLPEDIQYFETTYKIQLPDVLKEFMLVYGGCRTMEKYFTKGPNLYHISDVLYVKEDPVSASMEAIYKGHLYYKDHGYIPFAIDTGGWDFNFSIKPESYGQVWVDKFDSGEEDPFEFVCASFEEFINNLTEEEN